jgi:hypothetical protein
MIGASAHLECTGTQHVLRYECTAHTDAQPAAKPGGPGLLDHLPDNGSAGSYHAAVIPQPVLTHLDCNHLAVILHTMHPLAPSLAPAQVSVMLQHIFQAITPCCAMPTIFTRRILPWPGPALRRLSIVLILEPTSEVASRLGDQLLCLRMNP